MLGNIFKSLFGGSGSGETEAKSDPAVVYDSFQISPAPRQYNGQWQVAGRIEKTFGDDVKTHEFLRADTFGSRDDAANETVRKAKLMIDQQGDRIFG